MDNKTRNGVIVVALVAIAGFFSYKMLFPSKTTMAQYIIANNFTSGTLAQLMAFEDDYIKAWYSAAKKGGDFFTYKSETYLTKGGTKKSK
jgi:hypothetical protein